MAKLNKVAGENGECPSCHTPMLCVEIASNGNYPSRLQWQVDGKAHYSFDPITKNTSCKGINQNVNTKSVTSPEQKLENVKAFIEFAIPIAQKKASEFIDQIKGNLDADSTVDIQKEQIEVFKTILMAQATVFNC
jgi:hypothetical protein